MARRRARARARRDRWRGPLRLGFVLLCLIALNVYVFFFRGGTSIDDVRRAMREAQVRGGATSAADKSPAAEAMAALAVDEGVRVEGTVGKGESLGQIL